MDLFMNLTDSTQILLNDPQTLKQTSQTLSTQFESNQTSDIKPTSCQNSDIQIQSLTDSRKSNYQDLNVYQLLDKCDEFITQHSITNPKLIKKSSVNSLGNFMTETPKGCSQCKYHLLKELSWVKEKIRLQEKIDLLEKQLEKRIQITERLNQGQFQKQLLSQARNQDCVLKLQPQVFSLQIKEYEEYGFLSQSPSPESTSVIRSDSQNDIASQNDVLLESIKTFNDKLAESETENKYLKIENRSLQKTKTQIQSMKKQIQRTKGQRDLFKKKLISLAQKQSQSKEKPKDSGNDKILGAGLKERGLEAKKKNQTLFELSLTDASSIRESQNREIQSGKHINKPQRINFTTSFKRI